MPSGRSPESSIEAISVWKVPVAPSPPSTLSSVKTSKNDSTAYCPPPPRSNSTKTSKNESKDCPAFGVGDTTRVLSVGIRARLPSLTSDPSNPVPPSETYTPSRFGNVSAGESHGPGTTSGSGAVGRKIRTASSGASESGSRGTAFQPNG